MIKSITAIIIGVLLFVVDIFYGGFVFQFGWNHIMHGIGFPIVSYALAIGLSVFISIIKSDSSYYKDERERKSLEEILVYVFMKHTIELGIFWIISLFL